MTIDERLNALTMNLELTAHEVNDLRESVTDLRESVSDLRSTVDGLIMATGNLLKIAESHERRLSKLDGSAG